jgi:hypothetical protein
MRAALALLFAGLVGVSACSDEVTVDSAPAEATVEVGEPCVDDPLACPEGLTCWIAEDKESYRCHTSGAGAQGEPCRNVAGHPSCAAGLTCYTVEGFDPVCTPLCSASKPCSNGAYCQAINLDETSETLHACQPVGGADGGS